MNCRKISGFIFALIMVLSCAEVTGNETHFDMDWQSTWTIASRGDLRGLAFDGTYYYAGIYSKGIIVKYDRNGKEAGFIGNTGKHHDYLGHGVATDGKYLWTSDYGIERKVYKYDIAANIEVDSWEIPMPGKPVCVAYDGKDLWITVYDEPRIQKVFRVSTKGELLGSFPVATNDYSIGVAANGNGDLFVSDLLSQRLKLYSSDGKLLKVYNFFTTTGIFTTDSSNRTSGLFQASKEGKIEHFTFKLPPVAENKIQEASPQRTMNLPSRKPEVGINTNGNITIDGHPFFPLGIYSCITAVDLFEKGTGESFEAVRMRQWMKAIKAAGFNMVQSYADGYLPQRLFPEGRHDSRQAFMDYAQEAGLYVMLSFSNYLPASKITDEERMNDIRHNVEFSKTHPAMLVWYLADEPESPDYPMIEKLSRTLKTLDTVHPSFITDWREDGLHKLGAFCDLLADDGYPIGRACEQVGGVHQPAGKWYKMSDIAEWQDYIRSSQINSRPQAWGVVQMHRQPGDIKTLRFPTLEEMRVMTFMHLVKDVKGLFFFTFNNEGAQPWPEVLPAHWENMGKVIKSVHTVFPAMLSSEKNTTFKVSDKRVFAMMKRVEENNKIYHYLITVNPTCTDEKPPEDHSVSLGKVTFSNIPVSSGDVVTVMDEDINDNFKLGCTRQITLNGSCFSDNFGKLAVHVYKIGPAN